MVEVGTEGRESESAIERERVGPSGGAEHHVIVPWKSWAAQRKREKSERQRQREIERGGETRAVLMQLGVWKLKVQFSLGSLQEWCVGGGRAVSFHI